MKSREDAYPFSYNRREVLTFLGLCAASLTPIGLSVRTLAQARPTPACIVRPSQIQGPYFVDERLNRSDIRIDPSTGNISQGVPLRIAFNVSRVAAGVCAPLSGAQVDVWHCDAAGVYSDSIDDGVQTRGRKFLRGYQVTDRNGNAVFQTVYPGWYSGRAVHVHFKIRHGSSSLQTTEFTSQLYFDDALTDAVHDNAPYAARGQRDTRNAGDRIYASGGRELTLTLTKRAPGYTAGFDVGLQTV